LASGSTDQRTGRVIAAARHDGELITRASRRADWAGTVLRTAAEDLCEAHGDDGNPLTGLAEVVLEEAARVSHLAKDIESHAPPRSKAT